MPTARARLAENAQQQSKCEQAAEIAGEIEQWKKAHSHLARGVFDGGDVRAGVRPLP